MRAIRRSVLALCALAVCGWVALPEAAAALVWRKGEGWSYESGSPINANNPKELYDYSRSLQQKGQYGDAAAGYRRVIARWPTAFVTQDARLGLAECLTELQYLYKAYKEYQNLIEKHPNSPHFETVLQRQYDLATRFQNGEKHKIWKLRLFSAYDKAIEIYEQVVKNGPYSTVGAEAQFGVGQTYERMRDNLSAVSAYEKVLERHPKTPIAERAQFQIGWTYKAEAQRAEYDQNNANQAIAAFTDFLVRYPTSPRADEARELRTALKQEQSKGLVQVAQFYEKRKNYRAAVIYYNEVIEQNPRSDWAKTAQQKIAQLAPLAKESTATR